MKNEREHCSEISQNAHHSNTNQRQKHRRGKEGGIQSTKIKKIRRTEEFEEMGAGTKLAQGETEE